MYFLERQKPCMVKYHVGKPCYVETYRWKQVAVSEDKSALKEYLNGIVEHRAKREGKNEYDIRREYKIVSNDPNDQND